MFDTIVEAGAVGAGAGAALHYGSGYDQKMWLLAAPAPQHWPEPLFFSITLRHEGIYCQVPRDMC
jgi:hypothetical protein